MLSLLLASAAAAAPLPHDAADTAAAQAWIARTGHRFDAATVGAADMAPLVSALTGAKVIGIGEATHGTHQDEAFKTELIKALVKARSIDTIAIECNRAAAEGFDRYVRTGEGDPVALIRSPSFFAIWRNDAFATLLVWLRAWNAAADKPIRIIGIDDQDSGTDIAHALAFVARHDAGAAARLRPAFGRLLDAGDGERPMALTDWAFSADAATYHAAQEGAAALEALFDRAPAEWRRAPGFDEARYAVTVARQGLTVFEHEYRGADKSKVDDAYYGRRDVFMTDNLLARTGAGRAAIWAHDLHVIAALDDASSKAGYATLGVNLARRIGRDAYRVVGFTWSRAVLNVVALPPDAPTPPRAQRRFSLVPLRNDRPGELGAVFGALPGDGWWVDMRALPTTGALGRWGARPIWHGYEGWRTDAATFQTDATQSIVTPPGRGIDLLVWFRAMGPARTWPEAPAPRP